MPTIVRLSLCVLALSVLAGCSMFQSDVDTAMIEALQNSTDKLLPQYRKYAETEKLESIKNNRLAAADAVEEAVQALADAAGVTKEDE